MTAKTTADRIEQDGQYQFNPANSDHEILFNGRDHPLVKVMSMQGLFGLPELRKQNFERQAGDGGIPGTPFYSLRIITAEVAVLANTRWDTHQAIMDITEALQADSEDGVLLFRKPRVGTRMVWCRPTRLAFPSNNDTWTGMARGVIEWEAYDPRIYSAHLKTLTISVPPGQTSAVGTLHMAGNWRRGVPALVEITGPGSDIIVANNDHENRQLRLNAPVASNETLLLDTGRYTVTDVGTGESRRSKLARDNQWWHLVKGDNVISAQRSTNVGTMTVKVYYRDAFTL